MSKKAVILKGHIWTVTKLKYLIKNDERVLERAMIKIESRQTDRESKYHSTSNANGVGFSKFDAKPMGDIVKAMKEGRTSMPEQWNHAKNTMPKYASQLFKMMIEDNNLTQFPLPIEDNIVKSLDYCSALYDLVELYGEGIEFASLLKQTSATKRNLDKAVNLLTLQGKVSRIGTKIVATTK